MNVVEGVVMTEGIRINQKDVDFWQLGYLMGLDPSGGLWCEPLAHLVVVVPMLSPPRVERRQGKKERPRKNVRSLTEGALVREEGTNLQVVTAPGIALTAASKAPTEPGYAGMIGLALASPLEGFSVTVEGSSFVESDMSPECFLGLPFFEGAPHMIDLEEEGDVSLLREQVSLLRLREAKVLFECEVAQSKACYFKTNWRYHELK
ncbi:hypothetical protein ACLOJK_036982 [Asimina triloba]